MNDPTDQRRAVDAARRAAIADVRRAALVIGAIVVLAAAVAVWVLRPGPSTGVRQSTRGAADPFDAHGTIATGATRVVVNPLGTRVAVIGGRGLGVAEEGHVRYLFEEQTNVVDAVWIPTTTKLLVAEGPGETGRLSIVGVDGRAEGYVALAPSVGFGTGHGMAVDGQRRTAVVTASERTPLGAEHLHLVAVDLRTGATRALTPADGPDELEPAFAGDRVVFTVRDAGSSAVAVIEPASGTITRLTGPSERATARGVIGDRFAVYTTAGGKVWAVPVTGGASQLLATLDPADVLVAVDPTGGRVIVAREALRGVELATITIHRPA